MRVTDVTRVLWILSACCYTSLRSSVVYSLLSIFSIYYRSLYYKQKPSGSKQSWPSHFLTYRKLQLPLKSSRGYGKLFSKNRMLNEQQYYLVILFVVCVCVCVRACVCFNYHLYLANFWYLTVFDTLLQTYFGWYREKVLRSETQLWFVYIRRTIHYFE